MPICEGYPSLSHGKFIDTCFKWSPNCQYCVYLFIWLKGGSGCGTFDSAASFTPDDPGSNPVIDNFYLADYLLSTVCRKDANKEKRQRMDHF